MIDINKNDIIKGVIFESDNPLHNVEEFKGFTEMDKDKYKLVHLKNNIYMAYVINSTKSVNHADIINYYTIYSDKIDNFGASLIHGDDSWIIDGFDLNRLNYFPEFKNDLAYELKKYYDVKRCEFYDSFRVQNEIVNSWKNNYKKLK